MLNNDKKWIREIIGKYMVDLAQKDERLVAISADLFKACRMEKFLELFPERAYNTGIAEQNMVGFAAGLAHEGLKPYTFSMCSFISMRACEQCRTDVAYGNLNVKMIGVYSGVSGGLSGATHWSIEDCAIMSAIPNMTVLEPSDAIQAKLMMDATLNYSGPVYMRVSVVPSVDIYDDYYIYEIGKASIPKAGDDGAIICSGIIVQYAIEAAREIYNETGKSIMVVDMHTIKPIDESAVIKAAETGNVLVAQDHNVIGGLGYAVANVIAENGIKTKFKINGINDKFVPMAKPDFLYNMFNLNIVGLKNSMLCLLYEEDKQ